MIPVSVSPKFASAFVDKVVRYEMNREINNRLITIRIHQANLKQMDHVISPISHKVSRKYSKHMI